GIALLERGGERPVGLRRCSRQGHGGALGGRGQSEGGRRDDRRTPSVPYSVPDPGPDSVQHARAPSLRLDNVVSFTAQGTVVGQVAHGVKVLNAAFEFGDPDNSGEKPAGRTYVRQVSTRKRPAVNLAFDLAPLAGSGLYLSA